MSDIEDLADTLATDALPDRSGSNPGRVASGKRLGKIQLQRAWAVNTSADRLRLSVHTPSLPKLKFLEGSDD